MTLLDLWDRVERERGDRVALVADGARVSYAEVGARARRLAGRLARRWDVRPGEAVALLAPNCSEFVVAYLAIVRLGAVVQPVDERLGADEMRAILADSGARIAIVHRRLWPKVTQVGDAVPGVVHVLGIGVDGVERFEDWVREGEPHASAAGPAPADPAELMYTSGTAGVPKAVLRSHGNVLAAAGNAVRGFGYRPDDVIAISMPMSHSSALNSQMLPLLGLGGTLVLLDRFEVGRFVETLRSEAVTCMRAVPAMLRPLLATGRFGAAELPALRAVINSSAPVNPDTLVALKERFPRTEVMNSYGLTEASTCTVLPDRLVLAHPDSVGHPIEGVEMRVVDDTGREVPDGEPGEIQVRGEHVFLGYRNRPEATRAVLVGGWLRTGDVAHRDHAGLYYLHGRRDDVINCGGRKVLPLEVENVILQIPEVAEVAVVGAAHSVLGEVVTALVVPREAGLDPRRIINHCARLLPSHKVPFKVALVDALPKNSVGKTLRRMLRERSHA